MSKVTGATGFTLCAITAAALFGGCSEKKVRKPLEVEIVRVPRSEPLPERTEGEIAEDERKKFLSGQPLANYREKIEGLLIFDENENNAIEPDEARKYAMVMFDENKNGKLDSWEISDIEKVARKFWNKYDLNEEQVTHNIMVSATSFYSLYDEEMARIKEEQLKAREEEIRAKKAEYEAAHPPKAETTDESDFESVN